MTPTLPDLKWLQYLYRGRGWQIGQRDRHRPAAGDFGLKTILHASKKSLQGKLGKIVHRDYNARAHLSCQFDHPCLAHGVSTVNRHENDVEPADCRNMFRRELVV